MTSSEYALEIYGLYRPSFLPVTVCIERSLPSGLLESGAHCCRDIFVRYHVHLEYCLWLKSVIDGNTSLHFASSGKCTRENDHGDGHLSRTLLQGH
jgi:hypothetical protein